MMEFSVGDRVMHPKFGAGQITGEMDRELVDGYRHYFVIKVLGSGATAYVPMGTMGELGVRPVMSSDKLDQVLGTLGSVPSDLSSDYKLRQAGVHEKLETRRPVNVAEAVRDLTWHRKRKHLTQRDEALLNHGKELLATEIALVTDREIPNAYELIDAALSAAA
jgi:CarD family transcriptional regulator